VTVLLEAGQIFMLSPRLENDAPSVSGIIIVNPVLTRESVYDPLRLLKRQPPFLRRVCILLSCVEICSSQVHPVMDNIDQLMAPNNPSRRWYLHPVAVGTPKQLPRFSKILGDELRFQRVARWLSREGLSRADSAASKNPGCDIREHCRLGVQ
jgi:hypothetical protein